METQRYVGERPGGEIKRESEKDEMEEAEKEEGIAKTNEEHTVSSQSGKIRKRK